MIPVSPPVMFKGVFNAVDNLADSAQLFIC